jgi:hypothetical protein
VHHLPIFRASAQTVRSTLLGLLAVPLLSGCCGYFYYNCAPLQPVGITANQNVGTFVSARDQTEGLLAAAGQVMPAATVAKLAPQYATAATAANAWVDYAQAALRGAGTYDTGEGARKLGDVVASVNAFADAVESDAGVPGNIRVQYIPIPPEAQLDRLTAAPPIIAAAEQVKNGVAAGVDAIQAAQGAILDLSQSQRSVIADTIAATKWRPAEQVLSAPSATATPSQ